MNAELTTEMDVEPHEPHWIIGVAFPVLVGLLALSQASLAAAVYHQLYWLAVPLVFVTSHLMHGMLIGFSLYRAAHQMHHAYLASERDDELWPFIHPRIGRGARVLAAVLELTMGILFTPILFFRTFLRKDSPIRNRKVRRRVWMEFAGSAVVWTVILSAVGYFHLWKYFIWLHLIPAWLAGNMQSVRKYVEHVGLTGATVNSSTRSIVSEGWVATFLNFTLLHEPYHGVHHWRSGLPHPELPRHAVALEPTAPEERPPFRSFTAAVWDLIINLPDPKVGAQWRGVTVPTRQELARQGSN
jgi:fatty acid desaturase